MVSQEQGLYNAAFSRLEAALIAARVRGGGVYST